MEVGSNQLELPPRLVELIVAGVWPRDAASAMQQNLKPIVSQERVQAFAAEERNIYLESPPFRTIAEELAQASDIVKSEFWNQLGALQQIDTTKSLFLGDFGMGSDAPIILNCGLNSTDPPVFRLRYNSDGSTEWVKVADNFSQFAELLGF